MSWGSWLASKSAAPVTAPRLGVLSAGLCCPVGYQLPAAAQAFRANMDHFQESDFVGPGSDRIRVARLPEHLYGGVRAQRWLTFALLDALQHLDHPDEALDPETTAVLVLSDDASRPHVDPAEVSAIGAGALRDAAGQLGLAPPVWQDPEVLPLGRAGIAQALRRARQHLQAGFRQVLLLAVDSLLNAMDVQAGLLAQRLIVRGNSDGLVPGEAAAALLLRAADASTALQICGIGCGEEPGRVDGSVPSRGQGLTAAARAACAEASLAPDALEFRVSDGNAEQFYSREAAAAMARLMHGQHQLPALTLADKIGEVGAAIGPALLAWMWHDMPDAAAGPGSLGLLHLAADGGQRCALVLQTGPEKREGD